MRFECLNVWYLMLSVLFFFTQLLNNKIKLGKTGCRYYLHVVLFSYAAPIGCRGPSAGTELFSLWTRHAISLEFVYNDLSNWDNRFSAQDD